MSLEFRHPDMISTVSTGQLIGSVIWNILLIACGVYIRWVWPGRIRRDVLAGKISEAEAQAAFKKCNPKLGYAFFAMAVCSILIVVL